MNDKMVFGQYYNSDSWIHRLDPRTKIASVFLYMITVFLVNNIYLLLGFFLITIVIIATSNVPILKFLNSLKTVSLILVFTFVFQIIFRKEGELLKEFTFNMNVVNLIGIVCLFSLYFLSKRIIKRFRVFLFILTLFFAFFIQYQFNYSYSLFSYRISIYSLGLLSSSFIILRIISLLFISSLLTLTTKPTDLNNGLELLLKPLKYIGIKVSIFSMMISIALRFIPTLLNEADKILKAQASRGVDFKEAKLSEKIVQIVSLLVPMFVIAYKRAYELADAMEARGYIPEAPRTSINSLKYHFSDVLTYSISFLLLITMITLRIIL